MIFAFLQSVLLKSHFRNQLKREKIPLPNTEPDIYYSTTVFEESHPYGEDSNNSNSNN